MEMKSKKLIRVFELFKVKMLNMDKMVGFDSRKIIYNGNGKTVVEIEIGLEKRVMLS